jgi:hypothetical protein
MAQRSGDQTTPNSSDPLVARALREVVQPAQRRQRPHPARHLALASSVPISTSPTPGGSRPSGRFRQIVSGRPPWGRKSATARAHHEEQRPRINANNLVELNNPCAVSTLSRTLTRRNRCNRPFRLWRMACCTDARDRRARVGLRNGGSPGATIRPGRAASPPGIDLSGRAR